MKKKQFLNVVLALTMSGILTSTEIKEENPKTDFIFYEEDTNEEQETYSLSNLDLVSVSDALGNKKYYFVEQDYYSLGYKSITNPQLEFASTIPNLKETGHYWVPDSTKSISLLNSTDLAMMAGYDVREKYTIDDLIMLETIFSNFAFNPYLYVKDATFSIDNLFMVGNGETISIYDVNYCLPLEETVENETRTILYFYDVTNFKKALKCHYGISLEEERKLQEQNDYSYKSTFYIEKETSLYQRYTLLESDYYVYNIKDYLTEEQMSRGFIYYSEIEELKKNVNQELKSHNRVLLALNK